MLKLENTIAEQWAHPCDTCRSAAAAVYCRADSAYLCAACDAGIHSANPLFRRHHRVPITPFSGINSYEDFLTHEEDDLTTVNGQDEAEAASWLLVNPIKNGDIDKTNDENRALFGVNFDDYLDLDDYNSCQNNNQFNEGYNNNQEQDYSVPHGCYGSDFVSHSSMEIGIVPQSTSELSISIPHTRPPKGTIDLFSSPLVQSPTQLSPIDREARVMRYREKKKNRKFEKTIRYASRKAYAETRPRIKGRFVKRRDADEIEVDQMFCASLMLDSGYGLVPSF